MAIVVETGTGSATAESYISVADASTYHAARGNAAWAALATDALREAALRRATEYMVNVYRSRWQGRRKTEEQSLCWPRYSVAVDGYLVSDVIVPVIVARACAELALKASVADLAPDLTQGVVREQVGPIAVEYDKNSPQVTRYKAIDAMLAPFLNGRGGVSVGLVRT